MRNILDKIAIGKKQCRTCPEFLGIESELGPVSCRAKGTRPCCNKVSLLFNDCPLGKWKADRPYIIHMGFNTAEHTKLVDKTATELNLDYKFVSVKDDIFQTANVIKNASMAVIWNGTQHYALLADTICQLRQIPTMFYEWGLLPQKETFIVDPRGLCGNSILMEDLSWITEEDEKNLLSMRTTLQSKYPLKPEPNTLLILGQIENDSQILYHTKYNSMVDFVNDVAKKYPTRKITYRPHPKSNSTPILSESVQLDRSGELLEKVCKTELVVGLTSTALYESAILGASIEVWGTHPLSKWPELTDKVCAGILALRIPRKDGDLASIVKRFYVI